LPPLIFFAKGKKPDAWLAAKSKQNHSQDRYLQAENEFTTDIGKRISKG
jgi:hypothetical protein